LDKTKKYKEVLIVFYVGTALSVVLFGIFLNPKSEILVGISCGAIGFFMSGIDVFMLGIDVYMLDIDYLYDVYVRY
jgi:hypothetical protein